MKPLIISFFAVILCYSLLTNTKADPAFRPSPPQYIMDENSVYFEIQPVLQPIDSFTIVKEPIAQVL